MDEEVENTGVGESPEEKAAAEAFLKKGAEVSAEMNGYGAGTKIIKTAKIDTSHIGGSCIVALVSETPKVFPNGSSGYAVTIMAHLPKLDKGFIPLSYGILRKPEDADAIIEWTRQHALEHMMNSIPAANV